MEFTDDEIRDELARLGYQNVPADKLNEFKKDLLKLIQAERTSKNNSLNSSIDEQKQVDINEGQEFNEGNFTNHGSQWIQEDWRYKGDDKDSSPNNIREDWEYRGETTRRDQTDYTSYRSQDRRAKSATAHRNVMPGSYALHEMPIELDIDHRQAAANHSNNGDCATHSESSGKIVKRKTCRTTSDGARRIDESFTESETEDIFNIYQKIKSIAVRDCECGKSKGTTSDVEPPYRQKGGKKKMPSFIRKTLPPHERNLKRRSPFLAMDYYEKLWKQRPAPGEADRADVCKKIHQKMLQKNEVKIDNKVYVPNTYRIPSENPRTALRWRVRSALEKYELPEHGYYHDI